MRASILVTLLVLVAAPARAQVEIHSDQHAYVLGDARQVKVALAFGEVQIEGTDGAEVEVDFRLTCSRKNLDKCRQRGQKIRIVPRLRKGRFVIKMAHTRKGKIQGLKGHVKIKVPRSVPLDVDLTSGDVFVTHMLADVVIAGVNGDVDVVTEQDSAGKVSVMVVAGKAELWLGEGHMKGAGFPRSIKWQGPGSSRINIDLGTGDARVRLE